MKLFPNERLDANMHTRFSYDEVAVRLVRSRTYHAVVYVAFDFWAAHQDIVVRQLRQKISRFVTQGPTGRLP